MIVLKKLRNAETNTAIKKFSRPENLVKTAEKESKEPKELLITTGMKLGDLLDVAKSIQARCEDYTVTNTNSKNCFFRDRELFFSPDDVDDTFNYALSRLAFSQLGTKIGVPAQYLIRCLDSGKNELVADNVNSWLAEYDKDLFIRTYDDHIRGILSGEYSVFDIPDVLSTVLDVVNVDDYSIKGYYLNEERFHLRLAGNNHFEVGGEKDLFPALFIDSSDVGRSTLTVQFGVYKQVCTNGLMVSYGGGMMFKQRHRGIDSKDFYYDFLDAMKTLPDLYENVMDMITYAMSNKLDFKSFTEEDFKNFTAQVKGATKLTDENVGKVISLMQNRYGDTKWGYINALTEVAQGFTLERRLELEKVAGNILAA